MSETEEEKEKKKKYWITRLQEAKKPLPLEPLRITKPERERFEEIKKVPPVEPTRKVKPKEKKKGEN